MLVESVQKLVSDNESLRSDAISLREKVQERAPRLSLHNIYIYISIQKLDEEKRRLEQLL